ncbi:MAG: hypothetical protein RLZ10_232 [Bacteroidota bacterium]|jgi:predicted peptidase
MSTLKQNFIFLSVLFLISKSVLSCSEKSQSTVSKKNKNVKKVDAQVSLAKNFKDTIKGIYSNAGKKLPYTLLNFNDSLSTEKKSFVIFLHGAGERGEDNKSHLAVGLPNFVATLKKSGLKNFVVLAPQCALNERWVDVDWSTTAHQMKKIPYWPMNLALSAMDSIINTIPNLDTNRIYVTGLSMGGYGTWEMVQRRPNFFAAAIPICGGGDKTLAKSLTKIPIWCFHGSKDKAVPVVRTTDMYNSIKKEISSNPLKIKMTLYENKGHLIWNETYDNLELINWMLSQRKNP